MEHLHAINENLKKFVQQNSVPQLGAELCQVSSVDVTNFSVTCVGQSTGKVYYDVPLVSVLQQNQSIVPIPDLDSFVIVVQIDKFNSFVCLTGQLTQLYFTSPQVITTINDKFQITDADNNFDFEITPNGMKLVVGDQSFKDAITDLKTAIENLTVMTSTGASSVPINLSSIDDAFTKILSVLQ